MLKPLAPPSPCAWVLRLSQLKYLPQKQRILETILSSACFRAFNGKNGSVSNAQDTPFPMTRPVGLLWSIDHMPGWSFIQPAALLFLPYYWRKPCLSIPRAPCTLCTLLWSHTKNLTNIPNETAPDSVPKHPQQHCCGIKALLKPLGKPCHAKTNPCGSSSLCSSQSWGSVCRGCMGAGGVSTLVPVEGIVGA